MPVDNSWDKPPPIQQLKSYTPHSRGLGSSVKTLTAVSVLNGQCSCHKRCVIFQIGRLHPQILTGSGALCWSVFPEQCTCPPPPADKVHSSPDQRMATRYWGEEGLTLKFKVFRGRSGRALRCLQKQRHRHQANH